MALKTVIANFAKAKEDYEAQLKEHGGRLHAAIAAELAPLIPKGHVFVWTQATPYFNDGDPCVFRVNSSEVLTDKQYQESPSKTVIELDDGHVSAYSDEGRETLDALGGKEVLKPLAQAWKALSKRSNESLLQQAFGDHARVVVWPNGKIKREDYSDHD